MNLPKNKIPSPLVSGLFTPEYINRDIDLNNVLQEVVIPEKKKDAKKKVINKALSPTRTAGVPVPLTELEAEEADRQILNTQHRIVAMKQKLESVRTKLDDAINTTMDGKELSFKVDVSKKRSVQKALRVLFGENLDTITYSMYKEMLKAKAQLEKQEVSDYAQGRTK